MRESCEKTYRELHTGNRRILHHERYGNGFGDGLEMLEYTLLVGSQQCPVVGCMNINMLAPADSARRARWKATRVL